VNGVTFLYYDVVEGGTSFRSLPVAIAL
jgi:hypothetical protein